MEGSEEVPILDVHPPHAALHGWRDFFIHIATITIGLLIALGLEAAVEGLHHRHQRAEAMETLRAEIEDNRKTLAMDERALNSMEKELNGDLKRLRSLQVNREDVVTPENLQFGWQWDSMDDTAWETTRATGGLGLMPTSYVQAYNATYSQQQLVNEAGVVLSRQMTQNLIPLKTLEPGAPVPREMAAELIRNCAVSLNQLSYVRMLAATLSPDYTRALKDVYGVTEGGPSHT